MSTRVYFLGGIHVLVGVKRVIMIDNWSNLIVTLCKYVRVLTFNY